MTRNYDLIVVGAGPAGSAAAITAARNGAAVLLLERGRFPRHKVCGEFVSAESLDLLRDLLAPDQRQLISNAPRIARGRIFADGAVLDAEIIPPAASIPRFDLDAVLWDSCRQSGVESGYCGVQPISAPSNDSGTRINACAMVRSDTATTLPEVLHCHPALLERSRSWEPLMQPVSTA